jgi:hypothetical protein
MSKKEVILSYVDIDNHFGLSQDDCNEQGFGAPSYNCEAEIERIFSGTQNSENFSAKLNAPLLPPIGEKQYVLGSIKNLLPYYVLKDYFKVFGWEEWSEESNSSAIFCLTTEILLSQNNSQPIRLVTSPFDMYYPDGDMRITGKEICSLVEKYNSKIYKAHDYDNLYFICRGGCPRDYLYEHVTCIDGNCNIKDGENDFPFYFQPGNLYRTEKTVESVFEEEPFQYGQFFQVEI